MMKVITEEKIKQIYNVNGIIDTFNFKTYIVSLFQIYLPRYNYFIII